jgi:hypothetical protein
MSPRLPLPLRLRLLFPVSALLRRFGLKHRDKSGDRQDAHRKPEPGPQATGPIGQRAAQQWTDALTQPESDRQRSDRGRPGMRPGRTARERCHGGEDGEKRAAKDTRRRVGIAFEFRYDWRQMWARPFKCSRASDLR